MVFAIGRGDLADCGFSVTPGHILPNVTASGGETGGVVLNAPLSWAMWR